MHARTHIHTGTIVVSLANTNTAAELRGKEIIKYCLFVSCPSVVLKRLLLYVTEGPYETQRQAERSHKGEVMQSRAGRWALGAGAGWQCRAFLRSGGALRVPHWPRGFYRSRWDSACFL